MNLKTNCRKRWFALACLTVTLALSGCRKPEQEAQPQPSPSASASPAAQLTSRDQTISDVVIHILYTARRGGGVILSGQCGPHGIEEPYKMPSSATLEPMDKALQEVAAKYQNIYWRESKSGSVVVVDSQAQAKLLRVRVREFRIVEDREPDRVMQELWRAPEVAAFLRRNHVRFARRADGARKVLSPPMIVEMKNATVADILDRIAAGYRQNPPKAWVYQECTEKKEMLIDVQMR
jgi:hypothetical protein